MFTAVDIYETNAVLYIFIVYFYFNIFYISQLAVKFDVVLFEHLFVPFCAKLNFIKVTSDQILK